MNGLRITARIVRRGRTDAPDLRRRRARGRVRDAGRPRPRARSRALGPPQELGDWPSEHHATVGVGADEVAVVAWYGDLSVDAGRVEVWDGAITPRCGRGTAGSS
jgi:hypothetical protein